MPASDTTTDQKILFDHIKSGKEVSESKFNERTSKKTIKAYSW